jgi:hypothetical protein
MKKTFLIFVFVLFYGLCVKSQSSLPEFDTLKFDKDLELAEWFYEYEFRTQSAVDKFGRQLDDAGANWFSYSENSIWHTISGKLVENKFIIFKNIISDSLDNIENFSGSFDTLKVNACGIAISKAESYFQLVRDTANIYFNSFVAVNPDQYISVWFFPALQPSGQAVYGCEWEYVFDKSAAKLINQHFFISHISGVWIGKPRELWLNYRNTSSPTLGSLFFAVSYCDFFTRIHIDTQHITNTISKNENGNYTWKCKAK